MDIDVLARVVNATPVFSLPSSSNLSSPIFVMPDGEWPGTDFRTASTMSVTNTGLLMGISDEAFNDQMESRDELQSPERRVIRISSDEGSNNSDDGNDADTSNNSNMVEVASENSNSESSFRGEEAVLAFTSNSVLSASTSSSEQYYDPRYEDVIQDTILREELGFPFRTSSSPPTC